MVRKSIQSMLLAGLLVASIFLSGCASGGSQNYLMTGAGVGGALGAGIGAAVNSNNPWKGAAVGGLLGGAVGALGGEAYRQTQQPTQPQQPGYGYPPPNQGYNREPYYGGQPSYGQSGPPPGSYSQEGGPTPYGASQSSDPSYRYAY